MNNVSAENAFANQPCLFHRTGGRFVFNVAGSFDPKYSRASEADRRNRPYGFGHEAVAPIHSCEDKAEFNAMTLGP
jgi:hypothetical protein